MATKKIQGSELSASFHDRAEAHAFARFLARALDCETSVRPLALYDGSPSADWLRVVVPTRKLAQAEALRAAWDARQAFNFDEQSARLTDARGDDPTIAELARKCCTEIGLSDEQRRFLEVARSGEASGWDFASSAVASMKRAGYVRGLKKASVTVYELTEQGATMLAKVAS